MGRVTLVDYVVGTWCEAYAPQLRSSESRPTGTAQTSDLATARTRTAVVKSEIPRGSGVGTTRRPTNSCRGRFIVDRKGPRLGSRRGTIASKTCSLNTPALVATPLERDKSL